MHPAICEFPSRFFYEGRLRAADAIVAARVSAHQSLKQACIHTLKIHTHTHHKYTLAHTDTHEHPRTHAHKQTNTHSHAHTHSQIHSHTQTHINTHARTLTLPLPHTFANTPQTAPWHKHALLPPYCVYDVAHGQEQSRSSSFLNMEEAAVCVLLFTQLLAANGESDSICV